MIKMEQIHYKFQINISEIRESAKDIYKIQMNILYGYLSN
jgi:hypothetical protein